MSQQLPLLSQPRGSLEQLPTSRADSERTGNAAPLIASSRCIALVKQRHHTQEEPAPMHALGLPKLLQHV